MDWGIQSATRTRSVRAAAGRFYASELHSQHEVNMSASTQHVNFRGVPVPVHVDSHGKQRFSLWPNRTRQEMAFSSSHAGKTSVKLEGEGWVPSTGGLPARVAPRPGCEDGVVATIKQFMDIFHSGHRLLS